MGTRTPSPCCHGPCRGVRHWPREQPPTWSPGALLSPLLPCRRPISSGSLSDLTSTTNSLLRDGGSVLGGRQEVGNSEATEGEGHWERCWTGWWALGTLGPAQGRKR